MDVERARAALSTAARLHATFWRRPMPPQPRAPTSAADKHGDRRRGARVRREAGEAGGAEAVAAATVAGGVGAEHPATGKQPVLSGGNGSDRVASAAVRQTGDDGHRFLRRSIEQRGVHGTGEETVAAAGGGGGRSDTELEGTTGTEARRQQDEDCRGVEKYTQGLHEQGTFWSLEKRDPGDLPGLEEEFRKLVERFRHLLPPAWFEEEKNETTSVVNRSRGEAALGSRIAARALQLDAAARGVDALREDGDTVKSRMCTGGDEGASGWRRRRRGRTLVHGDLKTWNVFFRRGGVAQETKARVAGGTVKFIDWQVRAFCLLGEGAEAMRGGGGWPTPFCYVVVGCRWGGLVVLFWCID